jgi:hypothetical protein
MIADVILPDPSWDLMVRQSFSQAAKLATRAEPAAGSAQPAAALPARPLGVRSKTQSKRCANA